MKFKLYKNSAAPLIIPHAALALAELSSGDSITAHVAESAIGVLRTLAESEREVIYGG